MQYSFAYSHIRRCVSGDKLINEVEVQFDAIEWLYTAKRGGNKQREDKATIGSSAQQHLEAEGGGYECRLDCQVHQIKGFNPMSVEG